MNKNNTGSNNNSNSGVSGSSNSGNNKQLQHNNSSGFLNASGSPFIKSSSTSAISPFLVSKQSPPSSPMGIHRFNSNNNGNSGGIGMQTSYSSSSINTPNVLGSGGSRTPLDSSNFKEKIQQLGWMENSSSPTLNGNGRLRSNSVAIGSPGSTTFFQYQLEETSKKLEEKEKDAALAAEIGKILLERNQELEEQIGSLLENEKKYLDCLSEYEFLKNQNDILNENLKEATNENEILIEKLKQEEEIMNEKSKKLYISQRSSPNKVHADIDKLNQELEEYRLISQSKDKIISKIKGEKGDLEQKLESLNSESALYQNYLDEINRLKETNRELKTKYKDLKSFSQLNVKKSLLDDFSILKENCSVTFDSIINCCSKIKSLNYNSSGSNSNSISGQDELKLLNFTKNYINQLHISDSSIETSKDRDNSESGNLNEPIIIQLISKVKELNLKYQKPTLDIDNSNSNSNNNSNGNNNSSDSGNQDIHLSSSCILKTSSQNSIEEHTTSLIIETSKDSLLRSSLLILISTYLLGIINEINESLVKEQQTINELLEDITELNEKCTNINKVNLKLEEKLEESNKNLQETTEQLNQVKQRVQVLEEKEIQYQQLESEREQSVTKLALKLKCDLLDNQKQMDNNIQGLSLVIQNSFKEIEQLQVQNQLLTEDNNQLHIQMEDIVSIKDNDISFIKDQCSRLESKIKIETNNSVQLKENNSKLVNELEVIKGKSLESETKLQSIINAKDSEIQQLELKVADLVGQVNKLNEDIQQSSTHAIDVLNQQTDLVSCLKEELNKNEFNNIKNQEIINSLESSKSQFIQDIEKLNGEILELKRERDSLKQENLQLSNENQDLIIKLQKEIERECEKCKELSNKSNNDNQLLQKLQEEKHSIQIQSQQLEQDNLSNKNELAALKDTLQLNINQIIQLNEQITKFKENQDCMETTIQFEKNENQQLKDQIKSIKDNYQNEIKQLEEKNNEIINDFNQKMESANNDIEINLNQLINSKNQLVEQINILQKEKNQVEYELNEKSIKEKVIKLDNEVLKDKVLELELQLQKERQQFNDRIKQVEIENENNIKMVKDDLNSKLSQAISQEHEKLEHEIKEKEKLEQEIKEKEKLEQERLEKERDQIEKKEKEQKELLEKELLEKESNKHDCQLYKNSDQDLSVLVYISHLLKREIKSECRKCTLELFSNGLLFSELINALIPESIDKRALYKNCSNNLEKIDNIKVSLNSIKVLGGNQDFTAELVMNEYDELYRFLVEIFFIGSINKISLQLHPELIYLWKHNPEQSINQSKREESWDSFVALEESSLLRRWLNHFLKIDNIELVNSFSHDFINSGAVILNCLLKNIYQYHQSADLDSILHYIGTQLLPNQLIVFKQDIIKGNQEKIIILLAQLLDHNSGISLALSKSEISIRQDSPDIAPSSEEKACKGWLKTIDISTSSFDDFADGLLLLKALDKVQPGIVNWKQVNMNPTNTFSMTENCNYCVKLGKDKLKFSLVGIAGRDFVDGSKKFLLSFVWQMMRISVLKRAIHIRSNSSGNLNQELTESDLISKINKMVSKSGKSSQMKSFSDPSLKDGIFLLDLLDSIQPGCINYTEIQFKENQESYKSNAQYVITIARRLGCTSIIFWEDIVEVKGNMIMTFICDLINLNNNNSNNID